MTDVIDIRRHSDERPISAAHRPRVALGFLVVAAAILVFGAPTLVFVSPAVH